MDDNFQLLEILIFAVIAVVLVFRLRSILGRRTGNERRRDLPSWTRSTTQPAPQPVPLPSPPRLGVVAESGSAGVAGSPGADSGFNQAAFLTGARAAFEIIVQAFAAGDRAKLQPLLSPEVFRSFSAGIAAREKAGEKQETKILGIKSADVTENRVEGDTALVTVKFVSDQILVTRGPDGAVRDGDPDHSIEQNDSWTFSRPTRARDPNWILIATAAPAHQT
jgi:predicted lipid-binding transport protein (Tim44 family)